MRLTLLVLVLVVVAGCATAGGGTTIDRNVLTLEQLRESNHGSMYDLIRAERPWWLRTRGSKSFTQETPIMVYVDGTEVGTAEVLRSLSPFEYVAARYYSSGQAQVRFGSGNVSGAIELRTQE